MALHINDQETERLVSRAVRGQKLLRFLEEEVWPFVPRRVLGKRVSRRERETILGYGPAVTADRSAKRRR